MTVVLPVAGRKGRPPNCPYPLGEDGATWWRWAWQTPQAAKWDKGALYHAARRARLEDARAVLTFADLLDLDDLLAGADPDAISRVETALALLKQSASGALLVEREMRELDTRLGLNPAGLLALGWTVGEAEKEAGVLDQLTARRAKRRASVGRSAPADLPRT